jgi:Family of unknown function (DUF6098)
MVGLWLVRIGNIAAVEEESPEIATVDALVELVTSSDDELYVRFAPESERDGTGGSVDHESGLPLPGLSVNPLRPPSWWRGTPSEQWISRQVRAYQHLQDGDGDRRCWVVTGVVVDRGPDNEPLLADMRIVGRVADAVVRECERLRPSSPREEDRAETDGSAPWQSAAPPS